MKSKLFTPVTFGPLTLRNRTIRSAAFESMCPGNTPSQMLLDYHRSVAAGGVGMTTVAYAAVTQSGLSFDRQLWMRPSIISRLNELTKAVHDEGAAVGIQIGHCGNMSHKKICGVTPISAILLRLCVEWNGKNFRKWHRLTETPSTWHGKRGLMRWKCTPDTVI